MLRKRLSKLFRRTNRERRATQLSRQFRHSRFESLESRQLLTVTLPTLASQTLSAGAPLNLALNGVSSAGNPVTYTVSVSNSQLTNSTVTNPQLTTTVPQGNPSLKITVDDTVDNIHGDLVFQLFQDLTPQTVAKITSLVNSDFYDGLIFHRVIKDFMAQGGDPQGTGSGGPGFSFDDEFNKDLQFTGKGLLAMANSGEDTNGSQFFITTASTRWLDFNHTIFGYLTQGGDILDKINAVSTNSSDKPLNNVVMTDVTTITDTQNGVLRLAVPNGTTGTATVTVTAKDSVTNETTTRTFQVTAQADTTNDPPFLGTIAPVYTTANTPVSFDIPATDVEGDSIYYSGSLTSANTNLTFTVNSSTGRATFTPANGVTGVFNVTVKVGASSTSTGTALDSQVIPIYVAAASGNTAPILTAVSPSMGGTAPGTANVKVVNLSGTFINNGTKTTAIADPDQTAVVGGIALTGVTGAGTWAYSTDGTNYNAVGTVSASASLLLPKTAQLRYTPAGTSTETPTITYRAWDTTSGTAGNKVDTSTNGGTTAFSAVSDTATLSVNTAPVLTTASPSMGTTDENTAKTISLTGSFINNGSGKTTISDSDAGAVVGGIALTHVSGNGTWAYSTDGTTFTSVGTVSTTSALLLPKTAQLRYTPDAKNGETATIAYRAWDTTSGTAGAKADTTTNGGNTAFSSVTDTASLTVTSVNSAPVLTAAGPKLGSATAGTPKIISLTGSFLNNGTGTTTITDSDTGAVVGGIALTGVTGAGTWAYSTDGTNYTNVGTVSTSSALLLPKTAQLRYTPSTSTDAAGVTYRAWDTTTGTAGAKVDTTTNGGTTAFSTATDTASLSTQAAPVLTAASPSMGTTDEETAKTINLTGTFINNGTGTTTITDSDTSAVVGGIAVTGLTGAGTWAYSTDGTTFTSVGTVSTTSALLLPKTAQLRYTPDAKNGETATITYRAWDTTSGTAGTKVDTTTNGGTSAFSSVTDTASLTVTSVNDAPVLTAASPSLGSITSTDAKTINLTGSFLNNGTSTTTVTDVDTGAVVGGIALVGVTGNGTWAYSTDGTTFTAVGTVSTSSALLLPKTAQLRYTPSSASDTGGITYRAWDTTSGTAAGKVDTTTNGGTTAFSTVTDTASFTGTSTSTASISGYVYIDNNNDGLRVKTDGSYHLGMPGVIVRLYTRASTSSSWSEVSGKSVMTGSDGSYHFDGLAAGMYRWEETQPANYLDGKETAGTIGGTAQGTAGSDYFEATLSASQSAIDFCFGERGLRPDKVSLRSFLASAPTGVQRITQHDAAPVVDLSAAASGTGRTASYKKGDSPVAIAASDATVTDSDSAMLGSMRVTLANRPDGDSEKLEADTSSTTLTSSYASGVLTISGVAAPSVYLQVLKTVKYSDSASSLQGGDRKINVVVNDGLVDSAVAVATVTVASSTSSGYSITANDTLINATEASSTGFTFAGATVGATYNYTVTSSGGGTAVTGTGTLTSATQQVTGINVSSLSNGTLTYSVTVTPAGGTAGPAVTATSTLDKTAPTGYTITAKDSQITAAKATATGFVFAGAEVGATYSYTVTSSGGGTAVTGTGTLTSATQEVASINVSSLSNGTVTYSVTLTDPAGNAGTAVTTTATLAKSTAPSGYTITANDTLINATEATSTGFTFAGAQVGTTYNYSVTSSGGGTAVTGTGTISSATQQVTGINVSTLSNGVLTYSVTLTDTSSNVGTAATATTTLDKTAPSGYTITLDNSLIDASQVTSFGFTFANAEVGSTYRYTVAGGGGTSVTGTGTVVSATQRVSGINLSTLADGALTFGVTLTDAAGNTGTSATATATLDKASPTATVTPNASAATTSPITFTFTFNEAVTGVNLADFEAHGSTSSALTVSNFQAVSTTVYKVDVTGMTSGENVTVKLTASGSGIKDTAQNALATDATASVGYNTTASKFGFTTTTQSLTAGTTSSVITIQLRDAFGNAINAGTGGQVVTLGTGNTATGKFRNESDTADITTVTIPAGSSTVSFKYKDTLAGTVTLTASATGLTSATQQETITAAAASKFAFTTAAQTITAGTTSGTITVELRDQYDNVAIAGTSGLTVNLSTSPSTAGKFRNPTDSADITSTVVPAGSSSVSFKYKDTLAGTTTLTAAATGLTSATQQMTINAAAASKFAFTTTAQTLVAGATTDTITVQLSDQYGNAVKAGAGGQAVTLQTNSTATAAAFRNADNTANITSVTIPADGSTASFKYTDTLAGTATLTASATGLTSATQQLTVNAAAASKFAFTTAAQTLTAGQTTGTITVGLRDQYGNVAKAATGGQVVTLETGSTAADAVFRNAADTADITSVTIPADSSTASFKYKDSLAGTATLTVSATGFTSATQQVTVNAAAAAALFFTTDPLTVTVNTTSDTITVELQDNFGNPVKAGTGGLTVNLATDSTGGHLRNAADTADITSVIIAADSSTATFKYKDSVIGTPTLTASSGTLADGTLDVSVEAAA